MAEYIERIYPDYDIESAVAESSFEKVTEYTKTAIDYLSKLIHYQDFEKLKKELSYQQRINEWLIQKYSEEKNVDYSVGYYIGLLSAFREHLDSYYRQTRVNNVPKSFQAADLPHIDEILFTIESQEGIRHGKLAEAIGVEKNTLTGIMDKAVSSGVVTFSRPGKFKYYYLTKLGQDYCNANRTQHNRAKNFDIVLEELLSIIDNAENPEDIVVKVFTSIYGKRPTSYRKESDSKHTVSVALAQMINTAKPKVSLTSDVSNTCYRVENAHLWHTISDPEDELILTTNEVTRKPISYKKLLQEVGQK